MAQSKTRAKRLPSNKPIRIPVLPSLAASRLDLSQLPPPEQRERKLRMRHHLRQANEIYKLQMREAIMQLTVAGYTDQEQATLLGQSTGIIQAFRKQSMERAQGRARDREAAALSGDVLPSDEALLSDYSPPADHYTPRTPGPGSHRRPRGPQIDPRMKVLAARALGEADPPPPGAPPGSSYSVSGTVLDPPHVVEIRRACLELRKSAQPFDVIAEQLGILEVDARRYVFEALQHLEQSELNNADLERRLMVEQIDQMIAAIHPLSTGIRADGSRASPVLDAIDRSLRLMKQKAELLGLNQPPVTDIRIRLQTLAAEGDYDLEELNEVARAVFAKHKISFPEYEV